MKFAKTGVEKKEQRKRRKNPSAPQPQGPFWQRPPNSTEDATLTRAPVCVKFARAPEKCEKMPFSKRARFLPAPRVFFTLQTQFRQNFELRKLQNSNMQKKNPQKRSAKSSLFMTSKGVEEVDRREAPKLLVFVAFRVSVDVFDFVPKTQKSRDEKRRPQQERPKKVRKKPRTWPFCEKPDSAIR